MARVFQIVLILALLIVSPATLSAQNILDPCENLAHESFSKHLGEIQKKIAILKKCNRTSKVTTNKLIYHQSERIALLEPEQLTLQMLTQAQLKEALIRANYDGISITVVEIQQFIDMINLKISALDNDLRNAIVAGKSLLMKDQIRNIQQQLAYQRDLLEAERQYLDEAKKAVRLYQLQLHYATVWRQEIENQYKVKQRIEKQRRLIAHEAKLEQDQRQWINKLSQLTQKLSSPDAVSLASEEQKTLEQLQLEIIEAREQSNLVHVKIVLDRLNGQLIVLHETVRQNMSLHELNNAIQQANFLVNETKNLQQNIIVKIETLERYPQTQSSTTQVPVASVIPSQKIGALIANLTKYYRLTYVDTEKILTKITADQVILQQGLSRALSRRQELPGFDMMAWKKFSIRLLQLPSLISQTLDIITHQLIRGLNNLSSIDWILIVGVELAWTWVWWLLRKIVYRLIAQMKTNRTSVTHNMLFVLFELIRRNLGSIGIIIGCLLLIWFGDIPIVTLLPIIFIILVWFVFRLAIQLARVSLLESGGGISGKDVKLYQQLRYALLVGGGLTTLTVLAHVLPVGLEVRDFFNRLFMLFLAVTGVLLLRNWRVIPEMIEAFLPQKRPYLMRVVSLLSVLIPLTLLSTGIIGIIGYVDLAWTISLYEAIFLLMLSVYVFMRGLLNDAMDRLSVLAIRRLHNGWLWTQAILRPLDKILHLGLFLSMLYSLFYIYDWDRNSYVIQKLHAILNFPLIHFDPTVITFWSIIEMGILIAILIWIARWTREFALRWLFARIKDLGLRNSLAVLTQYTTVVIFCIIALRLIGVEARGINYILTALAFGVGFGLRDLARNYVSGFVLLIERPVRVGDLVTVGEYEGQVTHIGMRAIAVMTWDHTEVLVPNSQIFESTFMNWARHDSIIRSVIVVKIDREDNPNLVKQIIMNILQELPDIVNDPAPQVLLKEIKEPLLEFELRYFIDLSRGKTHPEIRSAVLFEIWRVFEANHIKAPKPQQDIHIRTLGSTSRPDETLVDLT